MTVSILPQATLKPVVLVLLVAVAACTWVQKDLGRIDEGLELGLRNVFGALVLGAEVGFYDGFIGPGTGSFLIFVFVRFFGFDFLRASATPKVVNAVTNLGALLNFGSVETLMWQLGLGVATCNLGWSARWHPTGAAPWQRIGAGLVLGVGIVFDQPVWLGTAT